MVLLLHPAIAGLVLTAILIILQHAQVYAKLNRVPWLSDNTVESIVKNVIMMAYSLSFLGSYAAISWEQMPHFSRLLLWIGAAFIIWAVLLVTALCVLVWWKIKVSEASAAGFGPEDFATLTKYIALQLPDGFLWLVLVGVAETTRQSISGAGIAGACVLFLAIATLIYKKLLTRNALILPTIAILALFAAAFFSGSKVLLGPVVFFSMILGVPTALDCFRRKKINVSQKWIYPLAYFSWLAISWAV